jgi:hypothetical protein
MAGQTGERFGAENAGGVTVVTFLRGRYPDELDQEQLREFLRGLIDGGCRRLVLDLGGVEDWNSPGFEAQFLEAHKILLRLGGAVALCCVSPEKHLMFSFMGWDRSLRFHHDRQDAVASLRQVPPAHPGDAGDS